MKVTILGCGTSGGVPRVGNHWGACDPNNPKNRRRRSSVLVEEGETRVIIDTSPDLREQLLSANVSALDGVLYTHDHGDHVHGIDDLRPLLHMMGKPVEVYGTANTLDVIQKRFDYVFEGRFGYPATCKANIITTQPFNVGNMEIKPFTQLHGPITSLGYRIGDFAYSTDVKALPEEAFKALEGVDTWVVDALRYQEHETHSHLEQTLGWIARVKPRRAILTHMTWEMDYETLKSELPAGIEPAYDGMTLEILT